MMYRTTRYVVALAVLLLSSTVATASCPAEAPSEANWPQFRGPERNGISPSAGLLTEWPEDGPPLVWQTDGAGRGYSSMSISDGKLYTLGDTADEGEDREYLICFDVADGTQLWKTHLGPAWTEGPADWQSSRSTPTLDGSRVYALTAQGDLICLDQESGQEQWRRNLREDFEGEKADGWGYSESVLIDGDRLICTPGGEENTMVALDKATGELVWSASSPGDRGAGHASIVVSEIGGTRVYVQTTGSGALGVRASDGEVLWTYEIPDTTAVIPTPIVRDDLVFFTAGYGLGGALLRQKATGDGDVEIEEIYPSNSRLQNKHGGVVLIGDSLYGDSDSSAAPFCADLMTGEIQWKARGSGRNSAAVVAADGYLYLWYGNSVMSLVKATPEGYEERGSFEIEREIERPSWAHPVVAGGRLYVREDDRIFCYDVRAGE